MLTLYWVDFVLTFYWVDIVLPFIELSLCLLRAEIVLTLHWDDFLLTLYGVVLIWLCAYIKLIWLCADFNQYGGDNLFFAQLLTVRIKIIMFSTILWPLSALNSPCTHVFIHLSTSTSMYSLHFLGQSPREFPQKYTQSSSGLTRLRSAEIRGESRDIVNDNIVIYKTFINWIWFEHILS